MALRVTATLVMLPMSVSMRFFTTAGCASTPIHSVSSPFKLSLKKPPTWLPSRSVPVMGDDPVPIVMTSGLAPTRLAWLSTTMSGTLPGSVSKRTVQR